MISKIETQSIYKAFQEQISDDESEVFLILIVLSLLKK